MSSIIRATLKKSQTYIVGPHKFEFGVPKLIDEATADYLAENAVKSARVTSGGQVTREDVQLFEFKRMDEDDEDEDAGDTGDENATGNTAAKAADKPEKDKATTKPAAPRQRGTTTKAS